eukprot:1158840-Pelagomonas_calceolata.AAC.1
MVGTVKIENQITRKSMSSNTGQLTPSENLSESAECTCFKHVSILRIPAVENSPFLPENFLFLPAPDVKFSLKCHSQPQHSSLLTFWRSYEATPHPITPSGHKGTPACTRGHACTRWLGVHKGTHACTKWLG